MRRVLFIVIGAVFISLFLIESWYYKSNFDCIEHCILFGLGGTLSLLTLIPRFPLFLLHTLLILSVMTMGALYALFFINDSDINYLTSSMPGVSLHLMFLLMSAFLMIPVVAHYSCRAKVGGCELYFEESPS